MEKIAEENKIEALFLRRKREIELQRMEFDLEKEKFKFEQMKKNCK